MKKNNKILGYTFIAALGGLLFGFDTAVISGAEKAIQKYFELNDVMHGFTVAIALIGTVFGAMFAGKPADRFGRKKVMIVLAILFGASALGTAFAHNWYAFIIYRFLGGLGVGGASVLGPTYIAEIAPANIRGKLVGFFQMNVVIGILLAFFSNYLIANIVDVAEWRWMLGVMGIPAALFFGLLFLIPATPRWLILKGNDQQGLDLLKRLGVKKPEEQQQAIIHSIHRENKVEKVRLFSKQYKIPILLAFLVAFFNQMSGINAIMYYAPRIFEMAGFLRESALSHAVYVGATNLIFTLIALSIIDRIGRKKLLLIGSLGMTIMLGLAARAFFANVDGNIMMVIYIIGFIAFFAFSSGAVIWVFISEIFPNKVRAKGQALGSLTHWIMNVLISWTFPIIAERFINGGGIAFSIFSVAMLMQLILVWKFFPETKGKTLEEIQEEMGAKQLSENKPEPESES